MIKIRFASADPIVVKHFSVEPIKKHIPDWYKGVPKYLHPETVEELAQSGGTSARTIKACVPVLDYLTSGYLIRAVSHTKFVNQCGDDETGVAYATSDLGSIGTHSHRQCPVKIEGDRKTYIKFNSPWRIKTPKGYSCFFYQPFFHMEKRFTLLPGIVDTDTYDKPINFPGWINGRDEVEVEPGTPLVAVFPFQREKWAAEIVVEDGKPSLFDKFLSSAYRRFYWARKEYT